MTVNQFSGCVRLPTQGVARIGNPSRRIDAVIALMKL